MYAAYPAPSQQALELHESLLSFMQDHVFPAETEYERYRAEAGAGRPHAPPGRRGAEGGGARSSGCGTCSCRRSRA